jgi:hypothetical protein
MFAFLGSSAVPGQYQCQEQEAVEPMDRRSFVRIFHVKSFKFFKGHMEFHFMCNLFDFLEAAWKYIYTFM